MVENIFKGGNVSTNYDYFDIAAGTGVQNFYGGTHSYYTTGLRISGAILTSGEFYSDEIVRTYQKGAETILHVQDLTLDLKFNTPRTANGNILVQVPLGFNHIAGGGNVFIFGILTLNKVNTDGSLTFIQSGMTGKIGSSSTVADTAYSNTACMAFAVSGMLFKKDEKLRLTVEQWDEDGSTGATVNYGIGVDPMNRNDDHTNKTIADAGATQLIVQIPFKLDVEI